MTNARPLSTPMEPNLHLEKLTEAEFDPRGYQRALGGLMYAMLGTRPDIAHSVGVLSQHAATPGKAHWNALMRVYRYLRATPTLALVYGSVHKDEPLTGYTDADHAGDHVDRRSISGYVFTLHGAAVLWATQKQRTVATSSTEYEIIFQWKITVLHAGLSSWFGRIPRFWVVVLSCLCCGSVVVRSWFDAGSPRISALKGAFPAQRPDSVDRRRPKRASSVISTFSGLKTVFQSF